MSPIDIGYIISYGVMIYSSILWLTIYFSKEEEVDIDPETRDTLEVTVLVPAYNEEEYIEGCLDKLISQNYPKDKLKIIVINDGSKDKTPQIAQRYANDHDNIELINKENSGKGDSLNYGLEHTSSEIVGCMDADSYPSENYIRKMIGYFEDENVAAVTPSLKVIKTDSWVQKVQWAEYIFQIFLRKIFAFFDVQFVTPGPGSLYKTEFLKETGGFDEDNLTEDMEVAFRVYDYKKSLENSTNAEIFTEAPESLRGLFRQRIRWYRGYIQNVLKYSHFFFNREYGNLGLFLLPLNVVWVGMVLFFVMVPIYNGLIGIFDYLNTLALVGFYFEIPEFSTSIFDLSYHSVFIIIFGMMSVLVMWLSLKTANEEVKIRERFLHYLLFAFIYTPLFAGFWIASIFEELRGVKRKW